MRASRSSFPAGIWRRWNPAVAEAGNGAVAVAADVRDPESVAALFGQVEERFGRLDLLFNNAGTGAPPVPLEDLDLERLAARDRYQPDRRLPLHPARVPDDESAGPARRADHQQRLDLGARPQAALRAYTATKHAVTGLTRSTSLDGRAYDIACGQIDIGNAATEMTERMSKGVLQADGSIAAEPTMDVAAVGRRGALHGRPAAGRERPVHDRDGDEDAVHRPRLAGHLTSCTGADEFRRRKGSHLQWQQPPADMKERTDDRSHDRNT